MRLSDIHQHLSHFPCLASLDAADVFQFVMVASHFVSINQGSIKIDPDNAPYEYLNRALRTPVVPGTWEVLWTILYPTLASSYVDPTALVRDQGLVPTAGAQTVTERVFWPPYQGVCPNAECQAIGRRLEKRKAICGYLYNLDGVKSICHHTTYCRHCKTSYRASYFSKKDQRTYYLESVRKDADCIQVNMHYFMTMRLLEFFNHAQSLAHPYIDHMCSECTEILDDPNVPGGGLGKRQRRLHSPLLGKLRHAQPCTRDAIGKTKACDLPEHQEAIQIRQEKTHRSRAALAFNQRTGAKLPEDPTAALNADTNAFNLDALIETDESDRAHEAGRDGEETFRATETLERKFPVLPPIQFFNNSCTFDKCLRKDLPAAKRFRGTIRPVDPFHMRTHSEKDAQCCKFNDPKRWPFLKKPDGNWRFNGSAAEITNAWYGGFLSICRGMHEINYRFFLEEMIRVRNESLLSKLVRKTTFCCNIPSHLAPQSAFPLLL
ncbi:hypothetical protein DFH28DRAFT_1201030 [Melampsora americana]|nr:hypothetical protein DFH28DRAFT_1201030 [Melampsora americana]